MALFGVTTVNGASMRVKLVDCVGYMVPGAMGAEENGEVYNPARQVFLTVTCGVQMSDEAFTAAVCDLLTFSDGSEIVTPEPSRLPVFGEKGAA